MNDAVPSPAGSKTSSSGNGGPMSPAVWTAVIQLGTFLRGPHDDEEIRKGRARTQIMALGRQRGGLIVWLGPDEGRKTVHALLAETQSGAGAERLPIWSTQEVGSEAASYSAARALHYSGVWQRTMTA